MGSSESNSGFKKNVFKLFFEITIVIIGITIAFALDRWSQSKSNTEKLDSYFELLSSDLEAQRNELFGSAQINRGVLEGYNKMLEGMQANEEIRGLFSSYFNQMQSFSSFNLAGANTYSIMQQSGDIQLIENIGLKSQLLTIESDYGDIRNFESAYLEKRDRLLDPLILKHYNTSDGTFVDLHQLEERTLQNSLYLVSDLLDALLFAYEKAINDIDEILPKLKGS